MSRGPLFLFSLFGVAGCAAMPAEPEGYDLLIANGLVHDGSGAQPFVADIGVRGGRIAAAGALGDATAARRIDATGMVVSPGFIDLHAHIEPIESMPDAESAVRQGVTTVLGGPDGGSPWPIGEHLAGLEKLPLGVNVAYLVGHNTIRRMVMKLVDREPTPEELEEMKARVGQAMREGAFGLSTGLKYIPGAFAKTDEVIALSAVAARHGGFYTSHLREEGTGLIEAVAEAIDIGREAGLPIVLTHHKAIGQPSWGASVHTLAMVDAARLAGQDVMIDQYPYTASHTGLNVLIPTWARAGGDEAFAARVAEQATRARIHAEIVHLIMTDRGGGDISKIQFAKVAWNKGLEGRTLRDWCIDRGLEPTAENGADLVIEAEVAGGANGIFHAMSDDDVDRIMRHPQTMIASDGRLARPGVDHPHPRSYGTFPRVLGHYARDRGVITLGEAIHKMTGMPARRLGLDDRGVIKVGAAADIVILDPATVADRATFTDPHQYPVGIETVIVNGVVTVDGGEFTANRGGQVLRRRSGGSSAAK